MKPNYLLKTTSLLAICTLILFSCNEKDKKVTYWEYYDLCLQAWDYYDEGKYDSASIAFNNAFELVKTPMITDYNKSIQTELKLKNIEKATLLLKRLAKEHGYTPRSIYFDSSEQKDSLEELVNDELDYFYNETLNKEFESFIDSIYKVDQNFRTQNEEKRLTYPKDVNIDSLNTMALLGKIKIWGFPSSRNVGVWAYNKSFIILLHADFDLENDILGEILYEALSKGEMKPKSYAEIMDRRANFRGEEMIYYQVPWGYNSLIEEEKSEISRRRNKIGLRSVEKCIEFVEKDGNLSVTFKY